MRPRGFTLVEMLVALAVLSVGLLGAVFMLLASLRGQADARYEIAATNLLRDVADRIRINPDGRAAYGAGSTTRACPETEACGAEAQAAADRVWFETKARELDSQAVAVIEFAPAIGPTAPDRYRISLQREDADRGPGNVSLQVLVRAPVAG